MQIPHYPVQKRAIHEIVNNHKRAIFLKYGTGKSRVVLEALSTLANDKDDTRILPHTPWLIFVKPHLTLTWRHQVEQWTARKVIIIQGTRAKRNALYAQLGREGTQDSVIIIPYSLVTNDFHGLMKLIETNHITAWVADESRSFANQKTQLAQAMLKLSSSFPKAFRIITSGNPTPESPTELWTQYQFAYGSNNWLGCDYWGFLKNYFIKEGFAYNLRLAKLEDIKRIVKQTSVTLSKHEEQDMLMSGQLPMERYTQLYYRMSQGQEKLYKQIETLWDTDISCALHPPFEEWQDTMSVMQKLRQLLAGFIYFDQYGTVPLINAWETPKVLLLMNTIREQFNLGVSKVLVWYHYRYEAEVLRLAFDYMGRGFKDNYVINPILEELEEFAHDASKRLIAIPISKAEGLNALTCCETAIYFSTALSAEKRQQAEKRIARSGQQQAVVNHIDLIGEGTIEEHIHRLMQAKSLTVKQLSSILLKAKEDQQEKDKSYDQKNPRKKNNSKGGA